MIDWAQTLTILGGVGAMWFGCFTILREDMKEMRAEHREDMRQSDQHWRELFTYMNNKIDENKRSS